MPEISNVAEPDQPAAAPGSPVFTSGSTPPGRFRFRFGPFDFDSAIPIPELAGLTGSGGISVHIRQQGVPAALDGAASFDSQCSVTSTEYLLDIPGAGRFYVANGDTVAVESAAGATWHDISAYLLGSVFGALCHQNGLLPLHASAIAHADRVTAFLGDSGAGKSTLAACLLERGYPVVSDDICLLSSHPDSPATASVIPVAGWLKLWRASLAHLGEQPQEQHRVSTADDKFRKYLAPASDGPLSLANVVFLARSARADDPPTLEPVGTAEALAQMIRFTYLGYIVELTQSHARVFRQCAQALSGAQAWRLTVPWGFQHMDEVLILLERQLLQRPKGAP